MNSCSGGASGMAGNQRWGYGSRRRALLAMLAAAPLLGAVAAPSLAEQTQPIVASLNPPPAGLNCTDAAAATSVYFQFSDPPFQVSQISLYLDGAGVPQDAVDEHWPTVTLGKGLHPGTNTVDVVANGANGQHIERRLVVQVGDDGRAGTGTAQVACDDSALPQAQQAQQSWDDGNPLPDQAPPPPAVAADAPPPSDTPPPVAYDDSGAPPPAYGDQAYVQPDAGYADSVPVYVYTPYPVVDLGWVPFVPFFGFGFFYSHYHPWFPPPHYGGGWSGGGGGWHGGSPPPGGWNGGGWRGNAGAAPGWRGSGQAPGQTVNMPRPGGWQGAQPAARPAAPQSGGQYRAYSGPVQVMRGAPSAPPQQQYRPAPAPQYRAAPAPQVYRGGGGGGGSRGGGSRGGGAGSRR